MLRLRMYVTILHATDLIYYIIIDQSIFLKSNGININYYIYIYILFYNYQYITDNIFTFYHFAIGVYILKKRIKYYYSSSSEIGNCATDTTEANRILFLTYRYYRLACILYINIILLLYCSL